MLSRTIACLHVCFLKVPFVVTFGFNTTVLQDVNSAQHPLCVLIVTNIIGALLGLLFIVNFNVKITKITVTANVTGTIDTALVVHLLHGRGRPFQLRFSGVGVRKIRLDHVLHVKIPTKIRNVVFSVSGIIIRSSVGDCKTSTVTNSSTTLGFRCCYCFVVRKFGKTTVDFVTRGCKTKEVSQIRQIF